MGTGRIKKWKYLAVASVVLSLATLLAAVGCGGAEGVSSRAGEESPQHGGEADLSFLPGEVSTRDAVSDSTAGASGASTLPELQPKVIKSGQVRMEAGEGEYAGIREDAVALATGAGGYVQDENSSRDDQGLVHAVLTLRVPAESFDRVMAEISALGEVTSSRVSTSDVSSEYVDLEARLRHLQAEEAFYLSLIGQAGTVQEMVTIREHLSSVQLEKEQVQGRMNYLDRQVEYSTLTLTVDEKGTGKEGGFWNSVGNAFRAFARGMRALALAIFYALPWLVLAALIFLVVLFLLRCRKKGPAEG